MGESLLERVEAATGPDRDLDAALHVAIVKPEQYPDDLRYFRLPSASMDHMEMCAPGTYWLKQRSGASLHTSPAYTASLDAALALVERVLPGWAPNVGKNVHHGYWHAEVQKPDDENGNLHFGATAASGPLALLAAALKALPSPPSAGGSDE